jgi:hypothetical protein
LLLIAGGYFCNVFKIFSIDFFLKDGGGFGGYIFYSNEPGERGVNFRLAPVMPRQSRPPDRASALDWPFQGFRTISQSCGSFSYSQ